ncbi:hypothetical protein PILCRDRAFT_823591 [Piloderma croceum F 1598]|uniref:Uncharacterized protein n=1 Tax=Piloderma croceum (strain F 1598) TaxID=765440 RepID=A0A0C3FHT7_PILCF|nr:hypothetical protein PILCRDRAFT_823591 [Piloderma croceum F 1598]
MGVKSDPTVKSGACTLYLYSVSAPVGDTRIYLLNMDPQSRCPMLRFERPEEHKFNLSDKTC